MHMLPDNAIYNLTNTLRGYSKLNSNFLLEFYSIQRAYLSDLFNRKFCVGSIALNHVQHILQLSSNVKVRRIATCPIITRVQQVIVWFKRFIIDRPHCVGCGTFSSTKPNSSITFWIFISLPLPATGFQVANKLHHPFSLIVRFSSVAVYWVNPFHLSNLTKQPIF